MIAASRGASVALAVLFGLLVAPRVGADDAGLPRVPILEFHVVGDPALGAPNVQLYDSAATFRAQLVWLAAHGYRAVTLDQMLRGWQGELKLPRKPVVLTFDDGYPQDVTTVLPLLHAVHWSGVLNLQVGNLVPARVRQLLAAGWEVDAHTFTHPDLTRISAAQLRHEIDGSRRWIRGVFGERVDFFCYPAGRFDQTVIAEVRRAGYLGAESELPGPASPADGFYALHRIEILRDDGVSGMIVKMR